MEEVGEEELRERKKTYQTEDHMNIVVKLKKPNKKKKEELYTREDEGISMNAKVKKLESIYKTKWDMPTTTQK
ncbi:uncharacterized protein G2W53_028441 [Senna tora]|uniref:Uncharacterized protein n=1 Tax=Senna tora TaxID=362788 RepID=A0A834T5Z6_9FABA|nr:uncharacterized protein G2W53_028441 [Senna tora]